MDRGAEPIPLRSADLGGAGAKLSGAEPGSFGQMNGHTDATLTAVPTDASCAGAPPTETSRRSSEKARREAQEAAAA